MFNSKYRVLLFFFYLSWAQCHVLWETTNTLQPVHRLFVKPSIDGTTGDLYVAATEEDGVKSQWLTDTPVNFLPTTTQNQPKATPVSFSSTVTKSSSPNEETITNQKQAVISNPAVRYAYAIPVPAGEGNFFAPYPYAIPATTTGESTNNPYCASESTAQAYSPFPYFYPSMMSAITNAMSFFKEGETEGGSQNVTPQSSPYWPHTYGYPYQYVMIDPKTWSQGQNIALTSTSATETSSEIS